VNTYIVNLSFDSTLAILRLCFLLIAVLWLYHTWKKISSKLDAEIANIDKEIMEKTAAIAKLDAKIAVLDIKIARFFYLKIICDIFT